MGHAVEPPRDQNVGLAGLDLHGRHVHGHHGGGAGALQGEPDDVRGEAGEKRDRGARMRLLAQHLDGAQDDAVDVPSRDAGSTEHLAEHDHGEVVRADLPKNPPSRIGAAKRRTDVADEHGVPGMSRSLLN